MRQHDGPATTVRVLGEEGEGTPTVVIEGSIDRPPGHRIVTRLRGSMPACYSGVDTDHIADRMRRGEL